MLLRKVQSSYVKSITALGIGNEGKAILAGRAVQISMEFIIATTTSVEFPFVVSACFH